MRFDPLTSWLRASWRCDSTQRTRGTLSLLHHTRSLFAGFLVALVLGGCFSSEFGHYARPVDAHNKVTRSHTAPSGLAIRGAEVPELGSAQFGFVQVEFHNQTDAWIQVRNIYLGFGGVAQSASVSVPTGDELASWALATRQRNEVRSANERAALVLLDLVGLGVAVAAHDDRVRAAGALASAGAETVMIANALSADAEEGRITPVLPETHLLSLPFAVPPHMFSKRFIVLQTGGAGAPCVSWMLLAYETDSGRQERAWLQLRTPGTRSQWQEATCPERR
jgi:hypothetical protein